STEADIRAGLGRLPRLIDAQSLGHQLFVAISADGVSCTRCGGTAGSIRATRRSAQSETMPRATPYPRLTSSRRNRPTAAIPGRPQSGSLKQRQILTMSSSRIAPRRSPATIFGSHQLSNTAAESQGITNSIHLIGSHCKPWRDCTNEERLDGENG